MEVVIKLAFPQEKWNYLCSMLSALPGTEWALKITIADDEEEVNGDDDVDDDEWKRWLYIIWLVLYER